MLFAFSVSSAHAASAGSMDGVWSGRINDSVKVVVRIVDDTAVAYSIKNTPIDIKFSKKSDNSLTFGDPENYIFKLKPAGAATLTAKYRDRDGFSRMSLSRDQS
jgi:hypothetical protein